jgi:general secretion pathway protein G
MKSRDIKFANRYIFSPKGGFTLVEILIVVVILGVLAAVVVPQFSTASSDTNLTNLRGNIQTIRGLIQLFKIQHNDLLPGQLTRGGDVTEARFISAMTNDPTYGMYVRTMPLNPLIATAVATSITCVNNAAAVPAGNEGTGWWFNAATGDFRASDSPSSIVY